MTAAGRVVKQTYPRLLNITSVDHDLHNAAERIHPKYENVDKLIAAVKVSMVKNKDRRAKFLNNQQSPTTHSHQMGKLVEGSKILFQKLSANL